MATKQSPGSPPTVTVVIPHRGDDTGLWACIRALRAQTYPPELFNVMIALNEPTQRSLDFSLRERESLVWEPEGFSYNARNTGLKSSTSDVVALTDSDTLPDTEWLTKGVAALSAGADIVAGHITVTTTTMKPSLPALYELMFAFDQQKNVSGGFSVTANLFARRESFAKYGVFQEAARTGEDYDWTRAAVEAGARLVYAPSAIVGHPARESWRALLAKARRTTLPFGGAAQANSECSERLKNRLQFHLAAPTSPEKLALLTSTQRARARFVRVVLTAYKVLCLLRIPPQFRKDLREAQAFQHGQIPSAQEAFA